MTVLQRWIVQHAGRVAGKRRGRSLRSSAAGSGRVVLGALCAVLCFAAPPAAAQSLPDGRAYEMVTPLDNNGLEVGPGIPSTNGNVVNWESVGACCGATTAAAGELYQSTRTASGWTTKALTPTPRTPLVGLFEEQAPLWWSPDLSHTIYMTPASYAAGDDRPPGPGSTSYADLYEQGPTGSMSWLSQGTFPGAGTNPETATFDGATPDGAHVAFDTPEQLTANATGLADLNALPQFLYERNVAAGTTNLVNVTGSSTTTSLTAPATGHVSTTLGVSALGTDTTSLSDSAGPAVSTSLTANGLGPQATTLTAGAKGAVATALSASAGPPVSTTLIAAASAGATTINVADASNLVAGETITIGGATPETATISSVGTASPLQLSSTFGTAGAGSEQFANPQGVAVDQTSGDEYVVDAGNFRVEKFDTSGHFILAFGQDVDKTSGANVCTAASGDTCQAGTQGSAAGEFQTPAFVAVDNSGGPSAGDVYVGDSGDDTVSKFDSSGNLITSWGSSGQLSGSSTFGSIYGIAVDSTGNLLVINSGNQVYEFNQAGAAVTNFATVRGTNPSGLAVGSSGNLFKVNGDGSVEEVTSTGSDVGQVTQTSATELAVDPATGDLLVDTGSNVGLYEFDSSGDVMEPGGAPCAVVPGTGCGSTATFGSPTLSSGTGVAGSVGTAVYVADAGNSDVAIFVPSSGGTPITLTAPLASDHASGAAVTYAGDSSITVASTTGFAAGQQITIGSETATIASVTDATHLALSATLTSPHASGAAVSYAGDTSITVASTTGFAAGQPITIDTASSAETNTVASVTDATHLALTAPLGQDHASGAPISYAGDTSITVASTANLLAGEQITIDTGGSAETATIAEVTDATHLALNAPLANNHLSGAPVTHAGDTSITVASTTGFAAGQQITIDSETATIASVTDATHLSLTATLTSPHQAGATVTRLGDTSITVASTTGFGAGQQITIDTGGPQETATVASVTDATHLALTGPLSNNHASGAPVAYGGDTTITVASTTGIVAGQPVTIGTGAAEDTANIAAVPDATHITLTSGLVNNEPSGAPVEATPTLLSPDGAILGNGNFLGQEWLPADIYGTTTNAISSDGSKIFFESPPSSTGGGSSAEGVGPPNLYMRDESNSTTTLLGDSARYEGASQDGSLVFFTSNEGLGGDTNTDNELYEFNTTGAAIGPAKAMSAYPVSAGNSGTADGNVIGATAISNDGSHVYFVANGVLASNKNAQGQTATLDQPNFYVFDTANAKTTFIATLSPYDVSDCTPDCGPGSHPAVLAAEPDIDRPAVPTPDGTVLAFDSSANLTNQNPSGPATTLTAGASPGDTSITVASTTGFVAHRTIYLQTAGTGSEAVGIAAITDATHLQLNGGLVYGHSPGDSVTQLAAYEIYRYATADGSLTCVSCTPAGVTPTGSASFGAAGGGSYAPPGQGVPMSSDGSRIFFETPDPLVAGDINSSEDVYEWENGHVSLISDGRTSTGAALGGTTPSGNDVFLTTFAQLVPQDAGGYANIYDARVGGGFPAPSGPAPAPCDTAESCRRSIAPTVFFPVPGGTTLIQPSFVTPSITVSSISAKARRHFAQTGELTLTVQANAPGRIVASAHAKINGRQRTVASASVSVFATRGGKKTLKLHVDNVARKALAKKHKLVVQIAVGFSTTVQIGLPAPSGEVAVLTLTTKHDIAARKKAGVRRSAAKPAHRGRALVTQTASVTTR